MQTRGFLMENINKTKLMMMGRESAVRSQRGRYSCGVCSKGVGANSIWYRCCESWCQQRYLGLRNLRKSGDNFGRPTCVRGVVVMPLEERAKVYCACVRPTLLYAVESWALKERLEGLLANCDQRMLRYMSRVRWQDRTTNEVVRRRCS